MNVAKNDTRIPTTLISPKYRLTFTCLLLNILYSQEYRFFLLFPSISSHYMSVKCLFTHLLPFHRHESHSKRFNNIPQKKLRSHYVRFERHQNILGSWWMMTFPAERFSMRCFAIFLLCAVYIGYFFGIERALQTTPHITITQSSLAVADWLVRVKKSFKHIPCLCSTQSYSWNILHEWSLESLHC